MSRSRFRRQASSRSLYPMLLLCLWFHRAGCRNRAWSEAPWNHNPPHCARFYCLSLDHSHHLFFLPYLFLLYLRLLLSLSLDSFMIAILYDPSMSFMCFSLPLSRNKALHSVHRSVCMGPSFFAAIFLPQKGQIKNGGFSLFSKKGGVLWSLSIDRKST